MFSMSECLEGKNLITSRSEVLKTQILTNSAKNHLFCLNYTG